MSLHPDPWERTMFSLSRREEAIEVLQNEGLLKSYFDRLLDLLTVVEANSSTVSWDTSLAWNMIESERVNVLVYGETGAGKSLLVRTLTGHENAVSSHTGVGTIDLQRFQTASGIDFIDTPGIKIPIPLSEADTYLAWVRDQLAWRALLSDLQSRLSSHETAVRPLAVVYVHRASSRVLSERLEELLAKAHEMLVPTFLLISDICGVDDVALRDVRERMAQIVESLGPNKLEHKVQLIEVNTESKVVSGHRHLSRGLPQFISALLSSLDPTHGLTLTRAAPWSQVASTSAERLVVALRDLSLSGRRFVGRLFASSVDDADAADQDTDREDGSQNDEYNDNDIDESAPFFRRTDVLKKMKHRIRMKRKRNEHGSGDANNTHLSSSSPSSSSSSVVPSSSSSKSPRSSLGKANSPDNLRSSGRNHRGNSTRNTPGAGSSHKKRRV